MDGLKYNQVRKQSDKQMEEKSIRAVEYKDVDTAWTPLSWGTWEVYEL